MLILKIQTATLFLKLTLIILFSFITPKSKLEYSEISFLGYFFINIENVIQDKITSIMIQNMITVKISLLIIIDWINTINEIIINKNPIINIISHILFIKILCLKQSHNIDYIYHIFFDPTQS